MNKMLLQILMGEPKRGNWFLQHIPSKWWSMIGKKVAKKNYLKAVAFVSGYRDFINMGGAKRNLNWDEIPLADKKNYIQRYSLIQRVMNGKDNFGKDIHAISASSGSSGASTYWPRLAESDRATEKVLGVIYESLYKISKNKTLLINNMALGTWMAGELVGDVSRRIASNAKNKCFVISPGANLHETVRIIKDLGLFCDQIVSVAYPPFAKQLADILESEGVRARGKIKFMLGGEGFSEEMRDYISKKNGVSFLDNIGVYASSDAGFVGSETILSIAIKREAMNNPAIAESLFHRKDISSMSLVQYNPIGRYIECIDGELVFTVHQAAPIVRYNTHDIGGILAYDDVIKVCLKYNFDPVSNLKKDYGMDNHWTIPFLYIFGRSDHAISIGGANIFVENISPIVLEYSDVHTFKIQSIEDENRNIGFHLFVELIEGKQLSVDEKKILQNDLQSKVTGYLLKVNEDYKDAYRIDPISLAPHISICSFGSDVFQNKGIKNKYK